MSREPILTKTVKPMKMHVQKTDAGSAMICALTVILIVSLIGAGVLISSTTRYNVITKQLKAWKEALYAAESGGDIGFAEVRKLINLNPATAMAAPCWSADGWSPMASPSPSPGCFKTSSSFGEANSLSSTIAVDQQYDSTTQYYFYRVRATGTAKLLGLPRGGMDDVLLAGGTYFNDMSVNKNRGLARGVGDSLLRKVDFKYDHFAATYGDGDFGAVPSPTPLGYARVSRRIELVVVPKMMFFDGAMKITGSFNGPGPAGQIDSYDSSHGAYPGASTASNPSAQYYSNSHNGNVSVATKNFSEGGPIYGDVTTNGGNVTHSGTQISGTIDNNVPFTIPPLPKPNTDFSTGTNTWGPGQYTWSAGPAGGLITGPTAPPSSSSNPTTPAQYVYSSSIANLTISPTSANTETYVTVLVNGDVSGAITINNHVNAKIYFTGNLSTKAGSIINNNVDNAVSSNPSKAGHLQFYGVSPTDGSTQTISIAPPGDLYAVFYAPNADMSLTGNPQVYGAVVAHNFTGNGNTGFHYDKELAGISTGQPIDFSVASFVEDVR